MNKIYLKIYVILNMFSPLKKILIIDDSIINIKLIEKYLSHNYIKIITCMEPTNALDMIKTELPDIILLDIHMPEITGLEILKMIKKDPSIDFIPVIMITASEEKNHLQQAYRLGSIDFIHKPIMKEELIFKVQNYLFHLEEKNILQRYYNIIDEFVLTIILDTDFIVLYVSSAFTKKTEFYQNELIGSRLNELMYGKINLDEIQTILELNLNWKGILKIKTKNGFISGQIIINKIFDTKNTFLGYQLIIEDITDKLALQELAIRDPLTKIYNRIKISEFINYEIESAVRYNNNFSIAMIDIDDFKRINDIFGHNYGDKVLQEFAKLLEKSIRKIDVLGRWGGEEFLIIFPRTNGQNSIYVANRIKESISRSIVNYNHITLPMNTASFGIAEYEKGDNILTLIEKADKSLYQSKHNGKNRITLYE